MEHVFHQHTYNVAKAFFRQNSDFNSKVKSTSSLHSLSINTILTLHSQLKICVQVFIPSTYPLLTIVSGFLEKSVNTIFKENIVY